MISTTKKCNLNAIYPSVIKHCKGRSPMYIQYIYIYMIFLSKPPFMQFPIAMFDYRMVFFNGNLLMNQFIGIAFFQKKKTKNGPKWFD